MVSESDNDDWITRLRGDDETRSAAIAELTSLLVRGLSHSLRNRYSGGVQPEDIAQEAVLKILESLDSFEGRSRFTTWAMTIATRIGISQLRRKHFQDVSLDALAADGSLSFEPVGDSGDEAGGQVDRQRLLQRLQELIESELTEKQRLAMRAQLEGMPVEEIASRTNSNRNAVYKLIHDARLRLRAGFENAGIVADDVQAIFA